ncbi:alpha-1,2-mannosidase, putative subfamily [Mycena alexandri]|uniref:Alpha-1,2-mannosidase, putative subfamily n=1 Tax=Mycena alexandri TaxID=1745969 RepID=A0AAD6SGR4_9AGAR|nr:alpha-1,2-mannosidase, putative subfamily [Mycena alexandri]
MKRLLIVFVFLGISLATQDPAQIVDPFIGTIDGGHVFPGATLPWGSVKAGPDSRSGEDQGGYVSDSSPITGFSCGHDDGTGGGSSLGNFPFLPLTSKECENNDLTKCTVDRYRRALEHSEPAASPGYFGIPLANGVHAETTVSQHAALYRFTYGSETETQLFLLEGTGDLGKNYRDGKIIVSLNPNTNGLRIIGHGKFIPSFGQSSSGGLRYTDSNGTVFDHDIGRHNPAGVLMAFPPGDSLSIRMGMSFTSTTKACAYAEEEIPDLSAFDALRAAARARWNEVLSTVDIDATGVSRDTQVLFWTSLYRTYIAPTNITGDNPLWSSTEPYWDSFYCIWDTFRVVHPLYAITAPIAQAEIIWALIDIYRYTGFLPDCRMSMDKGFTQGGSNADSLLSDSYVKGIRQGFDWEVGLQAMIKDATVMGDFEVEGRGGINSRERLGFVPVGDWDHPPSSGGNTRSASRLLEYAYNDFSIALVAQGLGRTENMTHFFAKSGDWFNIWNPNATHHGFNGFIQPRQANGEWFFDSGYDAGKVFRPDHCSPVYGHNSCFLGGGGGEFYEASSWEYSFYVPQDMASLVQAMGGPSTFSARLDTFFTAGFHDMGDEPGFLPTYLYNYVGQPVKTVDRVDESVAKYYSTSLGGLPGNDDSGSMGAYAVWSHLGWFTSRFKFSLRLVFAGFFPVAGQDTYLLNRPYFPKVILRNEVAGTTATIIASGLSAENKYIQSATLNGKSYTKNWITHQLFREGGRLELVMGSSKSSVWGTREEDLPPSLSTGGFGCDGCKGPTIAPPMSVRPAHSETASPSASPSALAGSEDTLAMVDEDASSGPRRNPASFAYEAVEQ